MVQNVIRLVSSVELLSIQIDDKLNSNLHISRICNSAANQLNALIRLEQFLSFHAKEVLINSYIIYILLHGLDVLKCSVSK